MPTPPCRHRLRIAGAFAASALGFGVTTSSSAATDTDVPPAKSPSGGSLSLAGWSIHGGGANVSGGSYSGTVSLAQVEAPAATVASAGQFELTTGWLTRAVILSDALFLDDFEP
jgi:hypothetical protein